MQITFNAFAYKADWHHLPNIENGAEMPYIWTHEASDYAKIGTAVVTVTLYSKDEIVRKELDALNAQLQATRAENQERENAILDRISKLQALSFVEAA